MSGTKEKKLNLPQSLLLLLLIIVSVAVKCCFIICMEELFLAQCLNFLIEPV